MLLQWKRDKLNSGIRLKTSARFLKWAVGQSFDFRLNFLNVCGSYSDVKLQNEYYSFF